MAEYNGWKNRSTWNVALWVGNSEHHYRNAVEYVLGRRARGRRITWGGFVRYCGLQDYKTRDGIKWDSNLLDRPALVSMLKELVD